MKGLKYSVIYTKILSFQIKWMHLMIFDRKIPFFVSFALFNTSSDHFSFEQFRYKDNMQN